MNSNSDHSINITEEKKSKGSKIVSSVLLNGHSTKQCENPVLSWTEDVEKCFLEFIDLCSSSATKCKNSSIRHKLYSRTIQVTTFLAGSLQFIVSFGDNISPRTKDFITMGCGIFTALGVSIQGKIDYTELSTKEQSACLNLERLTRTVRMEISKPIEQRVDSREYISHLENERQRILAEVGIENE